MLMRNAMRFLRFNVLEGTYLIAYVYALRCAVVHRRVILRVDKSVSCLAFRTGRQGFGRTIRLPRPARRA